MALILGAAEQGAQLRTYSGGHLRINKPSVCSKSAIFREAWHIVNLQPCP